MEKHTSDPGSLCDSEIMDTVEHIFWRTEGGQEEARQLSR